MVVVSGSGPPPHHRQTCWFYLTIALVVSTCALGMMLLIKDGSLITNRKYIDHIVEECGSDEGLGPDAYFDHAVCHYMNLWVRFNEGSGDNNSDDLHCFVHTFLLATMILSFHYIVASLVLLFGGIVNSKHLFFIPWLLFKLVLILILVLLVITETMLMPSTAVISQAMYLLHGGIAFALLTWLAAFVSCLQLKQKNDEIENVGNKFDYYRF